MVFLATGSGLFEFSHLIQNCQKEMAILASKDFTAAKKRRKLNSSEARPDDHWIKSLMLFHLSYPTVKSFDPKIAISGNFVLNSKNSIRNYV